MTMTGLPLFVAVYDLLDVVSRKEEMKFVCFGLRSTTDSGPSRQLNWTRAWSCRCQWLLHYSVLHMDVES
jgi:hypothetical protein